MSIGILYLDYYTRQKIGRLLNSRRHRIALAVIALVITMMLTASAVIQNRPVPTLTNVPNVVKIELNVKRLNYNRALRNNSSDLAATNSTISEKYWKPRKEKLNSYGFEFLLHNASLCAASESPFLLIVVPSVYHHREIRTAIRATWGSVSHTRTWSDGSKVDNVKLIFLFGTIPTVHSYNILLEEQQNYGDIVQADFVDSYRNLTIKMVTALRWISVYCPNAKYILKADEDVFVNVPRLIRILHDENSSDTIFGRIYYNSRVPRYGKWSVSRAIYPFDTYPGYAQGNTYVIPGRLAKTMFNSAAYLPYLPIEDAFITGILVKAIGAKLKNIRGFTFFLDTRPSFCDFTNGDAISKTKVNLEDYYDIWVGISRNITCPNLPKTDKETDIGDQL